MNEIGTTEYRTPEFFGLQDLWIETGPGEVTHYHEVGNGTPVVFLHGSGTGVSAAANWWLTLPEVGRHVRAIAIDLIGWGATIQPEDAEYGIREWGQHTLRLLDALGIDKAWIVGNSLGGWVALQLAVDHPDRVLGVISMGTGGAPARTAAIQQHLDPDVSMEGLRKAFQSFVTDPRLISDEMIAARQVVATYEIAVGRLGRVMAARERDRHAVPLRPEELASITVPTLLVHGRQDKVIPAERTWELSGEILGSDALVLSGCGHWSMIERAPAFNDAVVGFIGGRWRD